MLYYIVVLNFSQTHQNGAPLSRPNSQEALRFRFQSRCSSSALAPQFRSSFLISHAWGNAFKVLLLLQRGQKSAYEEGPSPMPFAPAALLILPFCLLILLNPGNTSLAVKVFLKIRFEFATTFVVWIEFKHDCMFVYMHLCFHE